MIKCPKCGSTSLYVSNRKYAGCKKCGNIFECSISIEWNKYNSI